ncbi:Na(+)/H(+) antiporter NhaC [bioreactor metagenome]|uniref:Na(+)/H(+) antiporter NhaC n=1 Tax=bioreactor metagenome TaxID=1076179 RepID=A0A644Z466_9ZZZZ
MLLVVSFLKVPAVVALMTGVLSGDIVAITTGGVGLTQILNCWNNGYSMTTGNQIVDQVLNNGGIQSMMWTFSLAFLGIALGGLLDGSGILLTVIEHIIRWIRSTFLLVLVTIVSSIASNLVMGENYLSSILNSRLWGTAYDKLGLQRRMLSRCVEEGATLSAPLIPWTTAGAFFYGAFKMSPITYLPFAFTNYICPLLSIVLVFFGLTVVRIPKEGEHDPYYEREHRNLCHSADC